MNKIKAQLIGETISTNENEAFSLYKKSSFGEPAGEKIQYTLSEAMFLAEKEKIDEMLSREEPFYELGDLNHIDESVVDDFINPPRKGGFICANYPLSAVFI